MSFETEPAESLRERRAREYYSVITSYSIHYTKLYEAAPLWFHDHLLGGTRLNATFAGLAGAYALIDPDLNLPAGLDPDGLGGRLLTPLVIQDRMFDTDGQLYFPNIGVNPEHPYWVPEFAGDVIVVNGKVWPYMDVDRQRYRFFLINGSNSRPYDMFLQDLTSGVKGPPMCVITSYSIHYTKLYECGTQLVDLGRSW